MKIKFIGTGSAFSTTHYNSNMVITGKTGKNLLVDAGSDIKYSLPKSGFSYVDIDSVYVSHLHADHIGGFEYLGFCTYFDPRCKSPTVYANIDVLEGLWESIRNGLKSIQGKRMEFKDYFNPIAIAPNTGFEFDGLKFNLVQTVHVRDEYSIVSSWGLLWYASNGQRIFLTTDTQFAPRDIDTFYKMANIIFHDCETSKFASNVHAHYNDLKTLPQEIKSKMWLYHYNVGELPDAKADGFAGFIEQGQEFDFSVKMH